MLRAQGREGGSGLGPGRGVLVQGWGLDPGERGEGSGPGDGPLGRGAGPGAGPLGRGAGPGDQTLGRGWRTGHWGVGYRARGRDPREGAWVGRACRAGRAGGQRRVDGGVG